MSSPRETALGFTFRLRITGLVLCNKRQNDKGLFAGWSFVCVRQETGRDRHISRFAYPAGHLVGRDGDKVAAPDPLRVTPDGKLFAERVLRNEVLAFDPKFVNNKSKEPEDKVKHLLQLPELDNRVEGVDRGILNGPLGGKPAIARLEVRHGCLTSECEEGRWYVDCGESSNKRPNFDRIATDLELKIEGLESLNVTSNKRQALCFRAEEPLIASFTAEPEFDQTTPADDPFPHFPKHFHLAKWEDNANPPWYCRLRPGNAVMKDPGQMATVSDKACPPSGGG